MKVYRYCIFTLFLSICLASHAQSQDYIVAKIGDKSIYRSDLQKAYNKSTKNNSEQDESLEQFLSSYIDLQLKLEEAKTQGLDKDPIFISEYTSYLDDLKKPYLDDTITIHNYAQKIYDRLSENIEVRELFVEFPKGVLLPSDTLVAYQKAMNIRSELKNTSFENLIRKYSNDSINLSNKPGYVGWLTALSTDKTIEDAIYNTPINQVSQPVRTNYGYYLVEILNRRPDQGQMHISQIQLAFPENANALQKDSVLNLANTIYDKLQAGADFIDLCSQYSSDTKTAKNGGKVDWFGIRNQLPEQYDRDLRSIHVGEITKPQESKYGYHIFKLDKIAANPPFEKLKKGLILYLRESNRNNDISFLELNKLKEEIPYELNFSNFSLLEQLAQNYMPNDSLFSQKASQFGDNVLLQINDKSYNINDFLDFLNANKYYSVRLSTDVLTYALNYYSLDLLRNAQNELIIKQNPELLNIAKEYYEGILIYNITDKEIWKKSITDKSILDSLYKTNPKKYKWDKPRYAGYLIYTKNKKLAAQAKKLATKLKNDKELITILKKEFNKDGQVNIVIEKGLWTEGENEYVDYLLYNKPTQKQMIDFPEFFLVGEFIDEPRGLDDVKGLVISDYQSILEKKWMDRLRQKYHVEIYDNLNK